MRRYRGWIGRLINSSPYRRMIAPLGQVSGGARLALIAPPLLWVLIANVGPLLRMANISFLEQYPLRDGGELRYTLANYLLFFQEGRYFIPFIRSIVLSFVVTVTILVLVFPVAYYVAKVVEPRRQVSKLLLILIPFWVGEIIRVFAIIMLLGNKGAMNFVFMELGMTNEPFRVLYTYTSLAMGIIYLVAIMMLLPLYAAIEKVPSNCIEAARDLGAGRISILMRVVLPLCRDGIGSGCALVFLSSMGVFAAAMMLGGPSTVVFPEVINQMFQGNRDRWPVGAAFAIIMLVGSLAIAGVFYAVVGRAAPVGRK